MNQEAIEYRHKSLKTTLGYGIGIVLETIAIAVWGIGMVLFELGSVPLGNAMMLCVAALWILGIATLTVSRGNQIQGLSRKFWSFVGLSFTDPPLREWEEQLENNNAFAAKVIDDD